MSTLLIYAGGGRRGKGCAAEAVCPAPGACGWDIAENVMYCHECGALSET